MLLSSTPTRRYRLDRPRREATRSSLTPAPGEAPKRLRQRIPRGRQRRQPPHLRGARAHRRRSLPGSCPRPTTSIVAVRGWSDRGPAASLRAGRNFASRPKIAGPIDDKIKQTKELETNRITRPAGRRLAVLREAAGRTLTGIPHT
jgi:hypothetical protein